MNKNKKSDTKEEKKPKTKVKVEKIEKEKVIKNFDKKHKEDKEIGKLHKFLEEKGFKRVTDKEGFYGETSTLENEGKIGFVTVEFESYQKENSHDGALIGQISLLSFERTKVHSFVWVAPDADPKKLKKYTKEEATQYLVEKIEEYEVDNKDLKIKKSNSLQTCTSYCFIKNWILQKPYDWFWTLFGCAVEALGFSGWFAPLAFVACVGTEGAVFYHLCLADCSCCGMWWCDWAMPTESYCFINDYTSAIYELAGR